LKVLIHMAIVLLLLVAWAGLGDAWSAAVAVPTHDLPWHLGALNASAASAPASLNTAGVKPGPYPVVVAVIDSGVLAQHPSLSGRLLPGYDMLSAPQNMRGGRSADFAPDMRDARCGERVGVGPFRTHGTEVASLIAGNGYEGVVGVNPSAHIVPVRLFGSCQVGRADLRDALSWAAGLPVPGVPVNPHPARVINLSFSGGKPVCGADLQQVLDRIAQKNIFVVAAVGNTFGKTLAEPANCEGVISVGAIDSENNIANYSALDVRTVIYAPGGGQRLPGDAPWDVNKLKVGTYDLDFKGDETPAASLRGVGTSYAAPLVSGFVSLLLSHRPTMTPSDFFQQLPEFSRPVKPSAVCPACDPRGLTMRTMVQN
jgi:serine protease